MDDADVRRDVAGSGKLLAYGRLVTHDHDLIDEVATRIWHFESDHKITDFKGTYEDYQAAVVAV